MRKTSAVALTFIAFAAGVLADEFIKPNGSSWEKIPAARQLGYVEGYDAGRQDDMEQKFCESARDPKFSRV
jgi:hypothetical protein